jgi:hypothetical protein
MRHAGRTRLRREERVEGGHAVGIGRRDGQALADVVKAGLADPARPCLEGMQCRQEEVPPAPGGRAAPDGTALITDAAWTSGPAAGRTQLRVKDGVDGGTLGRCGERADDVEVHAAVRLGRR